MSINVTLSRSFSTGTVVTSDKDFPRLIVGTETFMEKCLATTPGPVFNDAKSASE
jgi:hypothetical protein